MPSKDAKTRASDGDSDPRPAADTDKVYAGGNPSFDERKPTSPKKTGDTVHAGVNPDFDERKA